MRGRELNFSLLLVRGLTEKRSKLNMCHRCLIGVSQRIRQRILNFNVDVSEDSALYELIVFFNVASKFLQRTGIFSR